MRGDGGGVPGMINVSSHRNPSLPLQCCMQGGAIEGPRFRKQMMLGQILKFCPGNSIVWKPIDVADKVSLFTVAPSAAVSLLIVHVLHPGYEKTEDASEKTSLADQEDSRLIFINQPQLTKFCSNRVRSAQGLRPDITRLKQTCVAKTDVIDNSILGL